MITRRFCLLIFVITGLEETVATQELDNLFMRERLNDIVSVWPSAIAFVDGRYSHESLHFSSVVSKNATNLVPA